MTPKAKSRAALETLSHLVSVGKLTLAESMIEAWNIGYLDAAGDALKGAPRDANDVDHKNHRVARPKIQRLR